MNHHKKPNQTEFPGNIEPYLFNRYLYNLKSAFFTIFTQN
jgi:hypothetical protein